VTKQLKPEQRHRRLLLPTVSRDTLNNALDIALNSEPISKCFAFLKLAPKRRSCFLQEPLVKKNLPRQVGRNRYE
jgi:hypothetical protein